MALDHVVLLVGGIGGAKLALGLATVLPASALTIIVNNGDDLWHYGLRVCPDTDTLLYTLSGRVDKTNGWGIAGDTTVTLETLRELGESPWFGLKDRDIATHLLRTGWLREGKTLTHITQELARRQGIACKVLPMSDSFLETKVHTVEYGRLDFQEYFVRYRWQPTVTHLEYFGTQQATLSVEVTEAIQQADCIIVAPSNPWLSIAPILQVQGMRKALESRDIPCIAVTPLVGGQAVKGPTAKIMTELGIDVTSESIVDYYGDLLSGFVYDQRDTLQSTPRLRHVMLDTLMMTDDDKTRVATELLAWIETL